MIRKNDASDAFNLVGMLSITKFILNCDDVNYCEYMYLDPISSLQVDWRKN